MPGSGGSTTVVAPPPPPQPPELQRPAPAAGLGLQPLPSPQQVTQAVQQGRIDPFRDPRPPVPSAPASSAGASRSQGTRAGSGPGVPGTKIPAAQAVPAALGLQLTGVIQSGGRPEAIVVMGSQSDRLWAGQRGSNETPLLPEGWSVESININACSLVLKKGRQSHTYNCANS